MSFSKFFQINFLFLFIIILLSFFGVAALFSAAEGDWYPWSIRHAIRFGVCFLLMLIVIFLDIKLIYKYSYWFFLLCLLA